ncbi:ATP-dependent RNA helicase DDX27 [Oopsacas minuta]|uniref:RNA helicase n=1 Tax=Oopsacas minuta TaxID=111878 RepID=A0AAV7KFI6_9METZ|nr:ATP-dependent RNA helicase DDX27 [Oopsacas minuta]
MEEPDEVTLVFNKNFIFEEPLPTTSIDFKPPSILPNHQFTVKRQHRSSVEDKVARIREENEKYNSMTSQIPSESESSEDDTTTDTGQPFFSNYPSGGINSFSDMSLSRPLLKAVNQLGFADPTPIQSRAIPIALAGKDICGCAATGSGKTAAFLLPILERLLYKSKEHASTRVLILSPTRELAIQTHTVSLQLCHFSAAIRLCLVAGGIDLRAQERAVRNRPDIIVATPGRLIDLLHNTPSFDLGSLEVLVLDEADRMLEEHFELELQEILRLCPKHRQTLLFSATMTDQVEKLAKLSLQKPVRLFVDKNTDVAATLKQEFIRIRADHENDREAMLYALCKRTFTSRCLVFLPTKHLAHRLHICFSLLGINAAELHGNLTQAQRVESLESFKKGDVNFLLATDLAARGLDIEGVHTVINYNMPATLQQYIHRVGRTARAGRSGRAVSLVGENGRKVLKEAVKGKHHQTSVKRVVPGFIIEACKKELENISEDVIRVLEEEKEEKEMAAGEMEIRKAENLIKHRDEIASRPARTWFINKNDRKTKSKGKPPDKGIVIKQRLANKVAKRSEKPKRLRVFGEEGKKNKRNNKRKQIGKVDRNIHKQEPGKRKKFNKIFKK